MNALIEGQEEMQQRESVMKTTIRRVAVPAVLSVAAMLPAGVACAFGSGSTGADGAFNPSASAVVSLPANGIFNFTTVNIPAGVTVTFQRNATNTPVVILATGDVVIAGAIDVSGTESVGNTLFGNDGQPGLGGPGGYDGGRGAPVLGALPLIGGFGLGPGGGGPGQSGPGGGGGHATAGLNGSAGGGGGPAYGSIFIQPLLGGSGGGGGGSGQVATIRPQGGGGGGGAILIASSGTIVLQTTGVIRANGGASGPTISIAGNNANCGGGGSGGAIRLVANAIQGNGVLEAVGGSGSALNCGAAGGDGAPGRIRIEGEQISYANAATRPVPSADLPGALFLSGQPSLRITSVAGVAAPASPTGNMDVTLPASAANPAAVAFETTGVPPGSTVRLVVTPPFGEPTTAESTPLSGTTASASATASVTIPSGHSVFEATVTYTVVIALGDALSQFARNERVAKVTLVASLGGPQKARLTTVSGREYEVPAEVLRIAALGG
jgi:hypothetical protein